MNCALVGPAKERFGVFVSKENSIRLYKVVVIDMWEDQRTAVT